MKSGKYHISAVELRNYVDGESFDTDLMAGYREDIGQWAAMFRVYKKFEQPENFVANVLQRFNDYAKTGLPFGKFINGEKYDNVMKDIYEGRFDGADTYA